MEIPKGFEKFYPKNVLLLLKTTWYGVKNAAKAFYGWCYLRLWPQLGFYEAKLIRAYTTLGMHYMD